jgi:PKD repeat protein
VDFALEPVTQNIVYVSINTGEIRRIRYTGIVGNAPPVVVATGTPDVGVVPLQVTFSSAGTADPDNDPFTITWDFGDGQGSAEANPSHTYATPGTYDAVCSAQDADGIGRDTVRIVVAASSNFPSTVVLDDFNRANGAIGGSWVSATGLNVTSNELTSTGVSTSPVWNGAIFGADQEVYVTLRQITPAAPEHDLMLKVQGTSYTAGHIEVRYTAAAGQVQVSTYTQATQWVNRGAPIAVTFAAGDQFGARAYSNGTIEVFRNGVLIGTRSAGNWPFAANGGRLGMTLDGATVTRLDDFGGGNIVIDPNTRPDASITQPVPPFFFAAGDTIDLAGTATDGQDPPGALLYHWQVDLHHNTHIHPGTFVADGPTASFVGENHDDGTGVFYRAQLIVTDTGGLKDTASVDLLPEIDLEPGVVTTAPSTPGTTAPATYRFAIRNHGRMPSPMMRWRLCANDTLLAEGDTLVAAGDSVIVTRTLAPTLAAGDHTLRVAVDTLGAVVETSETNNSNTRPLTVVAGPGPDEVPPSFTIEPSVDPSVTDAQFTWRTDEVSTGVVRWGTTPELGDSLVDSDLENHHVATLAGLSAATRYYYRVVARDTAANFVTSALDSFTTDSQPVAVGERPLEFALSSPHPNPGNGRIALSLALPEPAHVEFAVLDVQGRRVFAAPPRNYPAGRHTLAWDGRGALHPGIYLARTVVDGHAYFRRFSVIR